VATAVLEIVDLGDGEIVLKHSEGDAEPLVRIRFSDECQMYLLENNLDVAKAMIQAGIQAASNLVEEDDAEAESGAADAAPRVIH
jgi:hypothetical protein